MAELPYMPIAVTDWIADLSDLTNEEAGALVRIRLALWRCGGLAAENRIARFAKAGRRWGAIKATVMAKLYAKDGVVSCPVTTSIMAEARRRRAKASAAGIASWRGDRVVGALLNGEEESGLKRRNSLRKKGWGDEEASDEHLPEQRNHNQNQLDNKIQYTELPAGLYPESAAQLDNARIYVDGASLVMRKSAIRRAQAIRNLNHWLALCGGDPKELISIIHWAVSENFAGASFCGMVEQKAERRGIELRRGRGPNLHLASQAGH